MGGQLDEVYKRLSDDELDKMKLDDLTGQKQRGRVYTFCRNNHAKCADAQHFV